MSQRRPLSSAAYAAWTILVALLLVLTVPYLLHVLGIAFMPKSVGLLRQLGLYQWVAVGIVAYAAVYQALRRSGGHMWKNLLWFETFSHEFTHTIVAILLLREVHSFHAEKSSGVISTSGRQDWLRPVVSLAPYCLPIYTYGLLALRSLMDFHGLFIFDIIIGLSIAFHVVNFWKDTSPRQPDINQHPLLFSYLYIAAALSINLAVVWVSFFPAYNVFTSFWRLLCAQGSNLIAPLHWLF